MKKFLIAFIAVLAVACTKENEVIKYVDKEYSWRADVYFDYTEKILDNSFSSGDCLYVSGTQIFTKITIENGELKHSSCWLPSEEISSRTCIGDKYFSRPPSKYGNYLRINMNDWNLPYCNYYFDMKTLASDFRFFCYPAFYLSPMSCIMGDYILIPYNYTQGCLEALLCKMKYSDEGYLTIADSRILILDDSPSVTSLITINTDGKVFFVTTSKSELLIVDTNGYVTTFSDCEATNFVKVSDQLSYLFGDHGLVRVENSKTLTKQEFNFSLQRGLQYSCIDGRVVAYRNSQIWETEILSDRVNFKELKTDGIEGNYITSVNQLGDSLVYVTTLSGGFYKPLGKFFADTIK